MLPAGKGTRHASTPPAAVLVGGARYVRDGGELAGQGLYLDLPAWGCHVFEVARG